jgi:hypothetical protein
MTLGRILIGVVVLVAIPLAVVIYLKSLSRQIDTHVRAIAPRKEDQ